MTALETYQYLLKAYEKRELLTISTTEGIAENMAISELKINNEGDVAVTLRPVKVV